MERLTPKLLIINAERFLDAATKVCKPSTNSDDIDPETRLIVDRDIDTVAYYLLGHSIELSLKAFLFGSGVQKKSLYDYGHNLDKLVTESRKMELDKHVELSEQDIDNINLINSSYSTKLLEYIEIGFYRWPKYEYLHAIAHKLVDGIKIPVDEKLRDNINKKGDQ